MIQSTMKESIPASLRFGIHRSLLMVRCPPTWTKKNFGNDSMRAFTLVEVIVAIFIMGITLASVAVTMQVGMVQYDNARSLGYVTEVLHNFAEEARRLNWTAIQTLPATSEMSLPDGFQVEQFNTERFEYTRSVADVDGLSDIKSISFIAAWTSLKGGQRTKKLVVRYAKNGLYDYYYGVSQ